MRFANTSQALMVQVGKGCQAPPAKDEDQTTFNVLP